MGFIEKINRFLGLYLDVFRAIAKPLTWFPFLVYALLQFLMLLLLENYVHPYIYPVLHPLIALLGEGRADFFGHYPELYLMLPTVYQWGKLIIGVVLEGLLIGITSVYFLRAFRNGEKGVSVATAFTRWPILLIIWAVVTGILLIINLYLPDLFGDMLFKSPRRMMVFEIFLRLLTVAVYSVFIYAIPAVIVYRNGLLGAFKTTFRLFARNPFFSFFLALIPFLFSIPISYATDNVTTIVDKFTPELVFYILVAGIFVDFLINYFITGTVVKFLAEESEESR